MALPFSACSRRAGAFLLAGAVLAVWSTRTAVPRLPDRRAALLAVLATRGFGTSGDPADAIWIDRPGGLFASTLGSARAIVRASPSPGEPADIFLVETDLSPEGVLLGVGALHNLSDTTGAEESRPVVRGKRLAWVGRGLFEGAHTTVGIIDLAGQRPPGPEWSRFERAQHAITCWQQTGQLAGVDKRVLVVAEEAKDVTVAFDGDHVRIAAGDRDAAVAAAAGAASEPPPAWLRTDDADTARPGNLVTWAVDRVRALPFVGDDGMQAIKQIAFTALDFVLRNKERVTGDTGAADIAEDLGQTDGDPPVREVPVDPELGWPPSPLEVWVTPALPGEGQWNSLDQDAFVQKNPGLPSAFLTTFIRTDRARKATRVYVALWDPRQVELHMMAGTVEPKSASGEAGPGLIPRTPEVMKRVVAGSNAGFQALHGEFGMMADGVVYLPPKPYAATVAVMRDGATAFGSWPESQTIPEGIHSYRQNMTVMVQDEKFNPFGRTWWGGTVPGSEDKTHTVRTGICLTREQFVAYFYGADVSPDALSQAMIQTRCTYGIALDMNAGHAGLEFYKVAPESELPPLGRPLKTDWEAEGKVSGLDGWAFRGRRLIRGMGLMNFPRYIRREGRDFFYMTLRPALPGHAVAPGPSPALPGEGAWRVKGLPQHGFPYALATTEVRPDAARPDVRVRLLQIDPRAVTPAPEGGGEAPTVAVLDAGPAAAAGSTSLWHSSQAFSIAEEPPVAGAVRLASGVSVAPAGVVAAALGVHDEDGMLVYAELAASGDAKPLDDLLARLGCSTRLILERPLSVALGGDTNLAGVATRAPSGPGAVRLARAKTPSAARIFEDTPTVPFKVWYPLQQHRVRYFKKPETTAATTADP